MLAEQHDEWAERRRYTCLESLTKMDTIGVNANATLEEAMLPTTSTVA